MRRKEKEKVSEVERLAEIERRKTAGDRQKEVEARTIELETNKRIEELVARRVEEELERRRDQIEEEVLRRVEEAKKVMEEQMMKELEIKKKEQLEEARKREVFFKSLHYQTEIDKFKNINNNTVICTEYCTILIFALSTLNYLNSELHYGSTCSLQLITYYSQYKININFSYFSQ